MTKVSSRYLVVDSSRKDDEALATASVGSRRRCSPRATAFATLDVEGFPGGVAGMGAHVLLRRAVGILRRLTGGLRLPVRPHGGRHRHRSRRHHAAHRTPWAGERGAAAEVLLHYLRETVRSTRPPTGSVVPGAGVCASTIPVGLERTRVTRPSVQSATSICVRAALRLIPTTSGTTHWEVGGGGGGGGGGDGPDPTA